MPRFANKWTTVLVFCSILGVYLWTSKISQTTNFTNTQHDLAEDPIRRLESVQENSSDHFTEQNWLTLIQLSPNLKQWIPNFRHESIIREFPFHQARIDNMGVVSTVQFMIP